MLLRVLNVVALASAWRGLTMTWARDQPERILGVALMKVIGDQSKRGCGSNR